MLIHEGPVTSIQSYKMNEAAERGIRLRVILNASRMKSSLTTNQCDQIGRFIAL